MWKGRHVASRRHCVGLSWLTECLTGTFWLTVLDAGTKPLKPGLSRLKRDVWYAYSGVHSGSPWLPLQKRWHGPRFFRPGPPIVRNIQPINRPWTDNIDSFPNRPPLGPLNNWQSCLCCLLKQNISKGYLPFEAKYLLRLFCFLWNIIGCSGHIMWQAP